MRDTGQDELERFEVRSALLGNHRSAWLQPPAVEASDPGLAVFLDGDYFVNHFDAPQAMAALQRSEELAPMWSVYLEGGPREVRWPESFCSPNFARFVCEELLEQLEAKVGATSDRLLAGVSLTGLSAAHAALRYPEAYARVLCLSGSFWWEEGRLARDIDEFSTSETAFYLTVGDEETATGVDHGHGLVQKLSQMKGVERMHEALRSRGYPVRCVTYSGGHDAPSWRRELPGNLRGLWALGR